MYKIVYKNRGAGRNTGSPYFFFYSCIFFQALYVSFPTLVNAKFPITASATLLSPYITLVASFRIFVFTSYIGESLF